MLTPSWTKNDKKAKILIYTFSIIVFLIVAALGRINVDINTGFNVHIFALISAFINAIVAVLLIWALIAARNKKLVLHKKLMLLAMILSMLFLMSYIAHHLLAGDTKYGGLGIMRYIYYFILATHIPLAALILPFILFSAYRGLIGEYPQHRKIAKTTWPIWFYVAITGPIIYILIRPYY